MASKQIALGTLLKIDHDDDGVTFDTMTLVEQITPPARKRKRIDALDLGDTLETQLGGVESASDMEFNQFWHPGDTEHEKLDTLFESQDVASYQIVTPHDTPVTDEFDGKVMDLEPESLQPDGTYKRKVIIHRTTAITRT